MDCAMFCPPFPDKVEETKCQKCMLTLIFMGPVGVITSSICQSVPMCPCPKSNPELPSCQPGHPPGHLAAGEAQQVSSWHPQLTKETVMKPNPQHGLGLYPA